MYQDKKKNIYKESKITHNPPPYSAGIPMMTVFLPCPCCHASVVPSVWVPSPVPRRHHLLAKDWAPRLYLSPPHLFSPEQLRCAFCVWHFQQSGAHLPKNLTGGEIWAKYIMKCLAEYSCI